MPRVLGVPAQKNVATSPDLVSYPLVAPPELADRRRVARLAYEHVPAVSIRDAAQRGARRGWRVTGARARQNPLSIPADMVAVLPGRRRVHPGVNDARETLDLEAIQRQRGEEPA